MNIKLYDSAVLQIGKHILYFRRTVFLLSIIGMTLSVFATTKNENLRQVKGLVRDAHTKKGIAAAQIVVVSNNMTTTTDDNGVFKMNVPENYTLIRISSFYHNSRIVSINGLDSVVVDVLPDVFSGYHKTVETELGFQDNISILNSMVNSTDISKKAALTADQLPQLFANGDIRSISRSGQTGQGNLMFIRGLNSMNANSQPLFVVDGIIWDNLLDAQSIHKGLNLNTLANIDLDDIESVSVIKDGTSVYGSKGSNGVILIKTKRATEMATKIAVSFNSGITSVPASIPMLGVADFKIYSSELLSGAGYTVDQISKLPYLNEDPTRSTYKAYHNNTNWQNEIYKPAISQSYHIGVQGGDEKALYFFSLGYNKNNGVIDKSNFQRYNLRYNGDVKLAKNLDIAVNVGFSRIDRNVYDDGVNYYTSPTWMSAIKSPIISPYTYSYAGDLTTDYTYTDFFKIGNPLAILTFSNNTVKHTNFNVALKPQLTLSKSIKLIENFNYSLNKLNEDSYRPMFFTNPKFIDGIGYTQNSRLSQTIRNNSVFNDLSLNFNKNLGSSTVSAKVGNRLNIADYESDFIQGFNSGSNSSINLVGGFSNLRTSGDNNLVKTISNYIVGEYNYANKYSLGVTASLDGSSVFGNETKSGISIFNHDWGFFPQINGSWLISAEKFMTKIKAISLLKLRAGYGLTGNDDIKNYQTSTYLNGVRYSGVNNGLLISNLANPTIQWESTRKANVGIDFGMFNDRLMISFDAFDAYTTNLLVMKQYQDLVGLDNYWANDGELSNRGFEANLNAKLINLKNFQWEFGSSIGHYVNRVEKLNNGSFTNSVYEGSVLTAVGNPVAVFYGYKTLGVFANENEASTANKGTDYLKMVASDGSIYNFGAGDIHFVDTDGNGVIDKNDRQIIGDPNPKFYGSFTNRFTYKNIVLSTLITYSYGNQVYNYMRSQLEAGRDFSNQSIVMANRWTSNNQVTNQPKAVYGDPAENSRFSDRWIEDGSYIRLKSVNLSYTLPIKFNFIEKINIWVAANNLVTLTPYLGLDPETSVSNNVLYQGVDAGLLPLTRSYNIGLKINL